MDMKTMRKQDAPVYPVDEMKRVGKGDKSISQRIRKKMRQCSRDGQVHVCLPIAMISEMLEFDIAPLTSPAMPSSKACWPADESEGIRSK